MNKLILLISFFGLLYFNVQGQFVNPVIAIQVNPSQPTTRDSVKVKIINYWVHYNLQISDNILLNSDTFTIHICTKLSPSPATKNYEYYYNFGKLDIGKYHIKVLVFETDDEDSCEKYLLNTKDTVFKVKSVSETGIFNRSNIIKGFSIFPNPAANSQTISFTLQSKNNVKITLHDITGRQIQTIADNEFSSGGHQIDVHTSTISPGMYFYKITAGGQQAFIKTLIER